MAESSVDICNDGLSRLGQTQFIQSFDEESNEAALCARFYEKMRDSTLRGWRWRFATRVASLGKLSIDPEGWEYAYSYPNDCLFARYLAVGVRDRVQRSNAKWDVRARPSTDRRMIVTDENDAKLVYTAKITDTFMFDPLFADALSWRMAWVLAMPLTREPKMQDMAVKGFQWALHQARTLDALEAEEDDKPESELIRTRS